MLLKLINWINKSNTKNIFRTLLIISGLCYLLVGTNIFGLLSDFDSKYMLDLVFYYSGDKFITTLANISVTQAGYSQLIHYIDYLFIATFYPLLVLILVRIINNAHKAKYYIILPILAMICDFSENLIIDIQLSYGVGNFFAGISGILTLLKFIFIITTIIIAIVFIIIKLKGRENNG